MGQQPWTWLSLLSPDVVLMDVNMPVMEESLPTRELLERVPRAAVVILSMHDDNATIERARAAGAVAFVAKQQMDGDLLRAIRGAARRTEGGGLGNASDQTEGIIGRGPRTWR